MTPPIALYTPATRAINPAHVPVVRSTDDLGEAIAELATRLHAATYQLLLMLRDFDAQNGWNNGFLSCAHWLHWRTSIDLGACREKVRVARALAALPLVSATMETGQLSYAKARALTRVATPENERRLVDVALAGTAAQVERVVRAWRRVDRAEEGATTNARHLHRNLSIWLDDDGMVVIRGRLSPEVGAVVQRALEAAADALFHEHAGAAKTQSITGGGHARSAPSGRARTFGRSGVDCQSRQRHCWRPISGRAARGRRRQDRWRRSQWRP